MFLTNLAQGERCANARNSRPPSNALVGHKHLAHGYDILRGCPDCSEEDTGWKREPLWAFNWDDLESESVEGTTMSWPREMNIRVASYSSTSFVAESWANEEALYDDY